MIRRRKWAAHVVELARPLENQHFHFPDGVPMRAPHTGEDLTQHSRLPVLACPSGTTVHTGKQALPGQAQLLNDAEDQSLRCGTQEGLAGEQEGMECDIVLWVRQVVVTDE